jgi:3-phosphoglycerate kinase
LLGKPVVFADDCVGPDAKAKAGALKPGDVLLLENLRFYKEEVIKDKAAKEDAEAPRGEGQLRPPARRNGRCLRR